LGRGGGFVVCGGNLRGECRRGGHATAGEGGGRGTGGLGGCAESLARGVSGWWR